MRSRLMPSYRIHKYIFLLILTTVLMASCYERQEGCLDINASNYSFVADDPCEGCCTYPTFSIKLKHFWKDTILFPDSVYVTDLQEQIQIVENSFYISDIVLTSDSGQSFRIEEKIDVTDPENMISEIFEDIEFTELTRQNYSIGTFKSPFVVSKLDFVIGIAGNYIATDEEDDFISDPDFYNEESSHHTNMRFSFVDDFVTNDTLSIASIGKQMVVPVSIGMSYEIPTGTSFSIPVVLDYDLLMKGIQISDLKGNEGLTKLQDNLKTAFRLEE